jgi:spore coat polysaccharide biosynthesis protein SpsF (cytidylyltransferase family)
VNIGTIIQARMSSARFPGKVLYEVKGKPVLQYVIERLQRSEFADTLVVATSKERQDDAICNFCRQYGVEVYRGPLDDVAQRIAQVVDIYGFEAFVRVCADSPLIDQALIDKGVEVFLEGDFDVVTNTLCRTYPKGQSVEIIRSDIFRQSYSEMKTAEDREHVTRFFYRNPSRFKIYNFRAANDYGHVQLSVDTCQDMEVFKMLVLQMDKPHWEYDVATIVELYQLVKQNMDVALS